MSMDLMLKQFKDDIELRAYAEAQYTTILELSKKIQKLEEENVGLKKLLENSTPLLEDQKKEFLGYSLDACNEEIISTIQLNKLKEISFDRELTLEETKRVEIYAKILSNLNAKKTEKQPQTADSLSNEDLLKLASSLTFTSAG